MKLFLVIEHENPEDRYDQTRWYVLNGETFAGALRTHYYHENIGEHVANCSGNFPTVDEVFLPAISAYEIVSHIANGQEQLRQYGSEILAEAIKEEKAHIADAPRRKREAKIAKLKRQAAELGLEFK